MIYPTWRRFLAAGALTLCLATPPATSSAHGLTDELWTTIQSQARAFGVDPWLMERILHCESGHYDPRVLAGLKPGSSGELGIAQILPSWTAAARRYGSVGAEFEARGGEYDQPADGIRFMARLIARGQRFMWHC